MVLKPHCCWSCVARPFVTTSKNEFGPFMFVPMGMNGLPSGPMMSVPETSNCPPAGITPEVLLRADVPVDADEPVSVPVDEVTPDEGCEGGGGLPSSPL